MPIQFHTFFSYGFRPFFSSAALFAGLSILIWIAEFTGLSSVATGELDAITWHAHEMLFGYLGAVLAGFTLTAVANWTGRSPVSGLPLVLLFLLWLAGRVSMALAFTGTVALAPAVLIDVLFIPALVFTFGREVVAGGNKRNLVVVAAVGLFGVANILFCLNALSVFDNEHWSRGGLGVATVLIALIGGRIIPAFTRNWLATRGHKVQIPDMGVIDKIALATTVLSVVLWVVLPDEPITAFMLVLAGFGLAARLTRWHGLKTIREPLLGGLHLAYIFLALSLILIGSSILQPGMVPFSSGLHLLTAGTIGLMTFVVMTRAALGHTNQLLTASPLIATALALIAGGAILRATAPWVSDFYMPLMYASAVTWSLGFLLFAGTFGPAAFQQRAD